MKKREKEMKWRTWPKEVLSKGPVIPVIVIDDEKDALPLAEALLEAGIKVLEITLRTKAALGAIEKVAALLPEMMVGAGTVITRDDLLAVEEAGGAFAISPGLTPELLEEAKDFSIPLIPGISTASELMVGMEAGYNYFKFFPAEAAGGIGMLKALAGPFENVFFCPTGGISEANFRDYLALENVMCVGGSWVAPRKSVKEGRWDEITRIASRVFE